VLIEVRGLLQKKFAAHRGSFVERLEDLKCEVVF
jgi:hypothetical protein